MIGYLNSDLTLPLNWYHGPASTLLDEGLQSSPFFLLDQTN